MKPTLAVVLGLLTLVGCSDPEPGDGGDSSSGGTFVSGSGGDSGGGTNASGGQSSASGGAASSTTKTIQDLIASCVVACERHFSSCENETGSSCQEACQTWKQNDPESCAGYGVEQFDCYARYEPKTCSGGPGASLEAECGVEEYTQCLITDGKPCLFEELWGIQCEDSQFAHICQQEVAPADHCVRAETTEIIYCCASVIEF